MRKLPRKTDSQLQIVLEELDRLMVVERHRTMAARALSEVTWRIYELRRAIAKEIRAQGGSWGQIGSTMGISRQSAWNQWHTVDGELGLSPDPDGPWYIAGGEHQGPPQVPGQLPLPGVAGG